MNKEHFTQLFRLYISGECTPAERNEFFDLLQANAGDDTLKSLLDELYAEVRINTPSASYVDPWGEIDLAAPVENEPKTFTEEKIIPFRNKNQPYKWAVAAAVMALIGVAAWQHGFKPVQSPLAASSQTSNVTNVIAATTSIRTGNKEMKMIVLSDSTRIWLNGATVLRYPDKFDAQKREVYLEGEAYFEVSNAAAWPFVIHSTGGISTTVLGTSFNIKAYPDRKQAIVSVVTGKVKITKDNKDVSTLVKGQELRLSVNSDDVVQHTVNSAAVIGWQTGDISFNDETLADILKDLQIFYGVNIKLSDPGLANLMITTGFKKNTNVENALVIVCELANAKYARNNDGYVVY